MSLLLLLVLTLACWPDQWQRPPLPWIDTPLKSAALTWLAEAGMVLWAFAIALRARRRLTRQPERRDDWLHTYQTGKRFHYYGLVALFGLALYGLGWGWAVQGITSFGETDESYLAPGAEFLVLAPFLVGIVLSWLCFYDGERAFYDTMAAPSRPALGRWGYVAFQARMNLGLVCVPVALVIVLKAVQALVPSGFAGWQAGISLATSTVVLLIMPWILRLVFGLQPFPEGPLKERLHAAAARLRFRCSNILMWHTRGNVANAMVAGLLPRPRYVLLSDRLVSELTPDEVEAVFGHEVGHVKHGHIPYYLGFLLLSMALLGTTFFLFFPASTSSWLNDRRDLVMLPYLGMAAGYIFIVFGFLSRRCERQADVYGCRAVSCGRADCTGHGPDAALAPPGGGLCPTGIQTFIQALEKVCDCNGISRDRPGWLQSWQHSTPGRRVEFLKRLLKEPGLERHFQRRVLLVKCASIVGLLAAIGLLVWLQGWDALLHSGM
jgi:Zn-dependent protease with chaperone function